MDYRATVIKAATRLFHEQGFSRTTTEEIAAAAGVTKRTLYRHMKSKEAILLAIHEGFLSHLLAPVDLKGSAIEQLAALVRNYVETVVEDRDAIRVFFEERKHLSSSNLARVIELRDRHEAVFRSTLSRAIKEEHARNVDFRLITEGILGAIASLYEWYRKDGELSVSQMNDLIWELFFNGIVAASRPSQAINGEVARGSSTAKKTAALIDSSMELVWEESPVLDNILNVAARLFYERGYDGTTTREIAEAAGLTKAALYYYIPSKEDVLFQLSLKLTILGIKALQQILKETTDPVETLKRIVEWQCLTISKNLGALRALSYERRFLDKANYEKIKLLREEYARLFQVAVRKACLEGGGGAHTDVIAIIIMGMLNFMNEWYSPRGRLSAQQISTGFFDVIRNGLVPSSATRNKVSAEVTK